MLKRISNLEVIPKHAVILYLKRLNPRLFTLVGFELSKPSLTARCRILVLIYFLVESVSEYSTVFYTNWRIVTQCIAQKRIYIVKWVKIVCYFAQKCAVCLSQKHVYPRQNLKGTSHCQAFLWVYCRVCNFTAKSLDVEY